MYTSNSQWSRKKNTYLPQSHDYICLWFCTKSQEAGCGTTEGGFDNEEKEGSSDLYPKSDFSILQMNV